LHYLAFKLFSKKFRHQKIKPEQLHASTYCIFTDYSINITVTYTAEKMHPKFRFQCKNNGIYLPWNNHYLFANVVADQFSIVTHSVR